VNTSRIVKKPHQKWVYWVNNKKKSLVGGRVLEQFQRLWGLDKPNARGEGRGRGEMVLFFESTANCPSQLFGFEKGSGDKCGRLTESHKVVRIV